MTDLSIFWTQTGNNALADLRTSAEFFNFCDNASIDAPLFLPTGGAVEQNYEGLRIVRGGLIVRPGEFQQ